jgi:hypothetical protein
MSIGSNVKSRVVNWILAVVNRDLDKAKLEEMQSRADSNIRSLTYRILFARTIILVMAPYFGSLQN